TELVLQNVAGIEGKRQLHKLENAAQNHCVNKYGQPWRVANAKDKIAKMDSKGRDNRIDQKSGMNHETREICCMFADFVFLRVFPGSRPHIQNVYTWTSEFNR